METLFFTIAAAIVFPACPLLTTLLREKTGDGEEEASIGKALILALVIAAVYILAVTGDLAIRSESAEERAGVINLFMAATGAGSLLEAISLKFVLLAAINIFLMLPVALTLAAGTAALVYVLARQASKNAQTSEAGPVQNLTKRSILTSILGGILLFLVRDNVSVSMYFLLLGAGVVFGVGRGFQLGPGTRKMITGSKSCCLRPYSDLWLLKYRKTYVILVILFGTGLFLSRIIFDSFFVWVIPFSGYQFGLGLYGFIWYYLYEKRNNVRLTIVYTDFDLPPLPSEG